MKFPHAVRFGLISSLLLFSAGRPVRADSLNFASDPPPGRRVARFDFNASSAIPDALYVNSRLAHVGTDQAGTVDGTPALIGRLEPTTDKDWNIFLELRPGLMEPNKVYRVTFDYKVLQASPEDGQICCSFRPDKRLYATTYMGNEVGVRKRISYDVTPGGEPDCGFRVGIVKGGAVAVDNILVEELPAIDTGTITFKGKKGSWKDFAGIVAHLDYLHFYKNDADVIEMLDLLQKLGVGMIRCGFRWDFVFPKAPDQASDSALHRLNLIVDEANKRGIKILAIVGIPPASAFPPSEAGHESRCSPADYQHYVAFLAETFKGRVDHWEISNEPDLNHHWRSPFSDYATELRLAYQTLKAVDARNFVINGGLSTTIFKGRKNCDLDVLHTLIDPSLARYYDALCLHIYPWNPDEPLYSLNNVIALMKQNKVSKPIWITETGFSVFGQKTETQQAAFLSKLMLNLAAHPEVKKVFIYNARQKTYNKSPYEAGLGIISYDFKPRPAYDRLQKLFAGPFPDKNPSFANPSVGVDDMGINGQLW